MSEITYHVEIADMKAFYRYYRRTSPAQRRLRLFLLLIFVVLSLDLTLRQEGGSLGYHLLYFFVMLVIFALVGAALTFVTNGIAQFRAYRDGERHGILGEHTMTLTPDALRERTAVNDTKSAWRGIYRVVGTPDHLFIFTQPNAAHTIPRRAFASPADAEKFLVTAQTYHEAAREKAA